jgi:hypothetical protein
MPTEYYRYICYRPEVDQLVRERKVQTTNPTTGYATWYTSIRLDDPQAAQQALSLKSRPAHRIGPVPDSKLTFNAIPLRNAIPLYGQPGGGIEGATTDPVYLEGLLEFGVPPTWVF